MNKNDISLKKERREKKALKNKDKVFPILGTRFNRAFRKNKGLMDDYIKKVTILSEGK